MKALILVSPKNNLGIITAVKWTIPEITTTRNTTQTISRIKYAKSQPTNKEFWAIIHIKLKTIETQKQTILSIENLK